MQHDSVWNENIGTKVSHCVQAMIYSKYCLYKASTNFLLFPKITEDLPISRLNHTHWDIPKDLFIADPNFDIPSKIDGLLGAELFFDLILSRKLSLGHDKPILKETVFGWIVSGKTPNQSQNYSKCNLSISPSLDSVLSKFWEVEEIDNKKDLTFSEQLCEDIFNQTTTRQTDGRFLVSLPLKENRNTLGDSKTLAIKRFLKLETRLSNDANLRKAYTECIQDYLDQEHMEEISESDNNSIDFYLPHHSVIKESSLTTKVRVVFDASAKTTSNVSLNDILYVGPTIQNDLFTILLTFRLPRFVFVTDIKQMYRQIRVNKSDCDLQKIIWRFSPDEPLRTFRLLTVTFGTGPAPYLATKSLATLAEDNIKKFPLAASIVLNKCYVDDIIAGFDDLDQAIEAQKQLIKMLDTGGFELHKWISNDVNLLENILDKDTDSYYQLHPENNFVIKTLGMIWDPIKDSFRFTIPSFPIRDVETKRIILSGIGKLFDPLGLINPAVVRAKIIMQQLWREKSDWDTPLDDTFITGWNTYKQELDHLNTFNIRRRITDVDKVKDYELFGFSDASELAYGACIYICSISCGGNRTSQLFCSKSRVAPLKKLTLPRLELCGAQLLAKLTHKIMTESNIDFKGIHLWTDSTIVLTWIKSESSSYKTFVSDRIAEIQRLTPKCSWNHVQSSDNPADVLSRGCSPLQLINHKLWWSGPQWLTTESVPFNKATVDKESVDEIKPVQQSSRVLMITINFLNTYLAMYSSYTKLIRVTAYIFRFVINCQNPIKRKLCVTPSLSCSEYQEAQSTLIKLIQFAFFAEEINILKSTCKPEISKTLPKSSKLKSLTPFLDEKGILRVGGRLSNADIPFNQKHPILLPHNSQYTSLLINHYHITTLHTGPQALLATIRLKFWPIKGKQLCKRTVNHCVKCAKCKPKSLTQIMGNLPNDRVVVNRPFTNCGIDFCGPFFVKSYATRKAPVVKIYICLFVCFSVKAIHLEICQNLTSKDFLAALKRFIARRGYPANIHCDNATTFVGACNELKKLKAIVNEDEVNGFLTSKSINFIHIPARSPSFGGLWESGVKSVKGHLKRVIGNSLLTIEEFSTLIIEIESCVNSRPLTAISADPNDEYPLTPAHFLIGEPLIDITEPSLLQTPVSHLSRWQVVQHKKQIFWKRWSSEYLSSLQSRTKWTKDQPNIKLGSIVLIKEDNRPPLKWDIARVVDLHPGLDIPWSI